MGIFANIYKSRPAGGISTFNNSRSYKTKGLWELAINQSSSKKMHREDEDYFYVPVNKIEESPYTGIVINFETKGNGDNDHTYLVNNIVTHNCDGKKWHEDIESKKKDINRDYKLANVGWRILRFNENAIEESPKEVAKVIMQHVSDASKERSKRMKKAGTDELLVKQAQSLTSFEGVEDKQILYDVTPIPGDLGTIYIIGLDNESI